MILERLFQSGIGNILGNGGLDFEKHYRSYWFFKSQRVKRTLKMAFASFTPINAPLWKNT